MTTQVLMVKIFLTIRCGMEMVVQRLVAAVVSTVLHGFALNYPSRLRTILSYGCVVYTTLTIATR